MIPDWLHVLSIVSLALGAVCALVIAWDLRRHPQHMWIMNVVWPVTALFGSVLALWGYYSYGRLAAHEKTHPAMERGEEMPHKALTPFPVKVGKGATHCGSGCTLGDICAEWLAFFVPVGGLARLEVAVQDQDVRGLDRRLHLRVRVRRRVPVLHDQAHGGLSVGEGLKEAIKADTLSLTAWQVGMYGLMALAHFWIFKQLLGARLHVNSVEFWFMMQIAMLAGFVTSYPVNWWLIRRGIKEAM